MKVLYTGSFNPFHNGHQYIFDNVCKCFGKENVWIGVDVGFRDGLSREEYIEAVQASNNGDTTIILKKERKKYDECNKYF